MKDKLIQEVATGSNQMTPLETAAYNFLLARSDRYGCSPTGDLVDFAKEREKWTEIKGADTLPPMVGFYLWKGHKWMEVDYKYFDWEEDSVAHILQTRTHWRGLELPEVKDGK